MGRRESLLATVGLALVIMAVGNGCSPDEQRQDAAPASPSSTASVPTSDSTLAPSAVDGWSETDVLAALPHPELPVDPFDYAVGLPATHESVNLRFVDSAAGAPITDELATLGRVLFYDRRLSQNGEISCASCHIQSESFSDPAQFSSGFEGELTVRNSMPLLNLRWFPGEVMFWDGRADSIEEQALMPIQDMVEMGLTLDELETRVADAAYYPPLFQDAFGDEDVTSERIASAIAAFVRSIVSFDSKFDAAIAETGTVFGTFPNYTAEEQLGKEIFFGEHNDLTRGSCSTCHMFANPAGFLPPEGAPGAPPPGAPEPDNLAIIQPLFLVNNGLFDDDDGGLGDVTGASDDDGKFKSPSLRNVALTAPYMHDGRFDTLEEVVAHYSEGVGAHPNLDPQLIDFFGINDDGDDVLQFDLSEAEQQAVIAFLHTLTDESVLTEERWSDPFPNS